MVTPLYAGGTSSNPGYDIIFFEIFLLEYHVKWRKRLKSDSTGPYDEVHIDIGDSFRININLSPLIGQEEANKN